VLASDDTLKAAVDALLDGSQQDFPVVEDERLVGILQRQDLIRALSEHGTAKPVGEVMQRDCRTIEASAKLDEVINQIQSGPCPVLREGKLVGLLTLENIGEWMMVRSALRQRKTGTLP